MTLLDWRSWKLRRVCRSSLAAETQAFTDAIDRLNWIRLFLADAIAPQSIDLRRVEEVLQNLPTSYAITDCKSLYDSIERQESSGLGLQEKRTAVEVTAIRQTMSQTNLKTKWVNSDRQLADVLTKPGVSPDTILGLLRRGRWKIVFDPEFVSAKRCKAAKRERHFTKMGQSKMTPKGKSAARPRTQPCVTDTPKQ